MEEYGSRDGNAHFRSRHPQGVVTPHTSVKVGVLSVLEIGQYKWILCGRVWLT